MLLSRLHKYILLLGPHVSGISMNGLATTTLRCDGMEDYLLCKLLYKDINKGICEEATQNVAWMFYYRGRVLSAERRHTITVGFQPDNRGRDGGRMAPSSNLSTTLMDALEWAGTSRKMVLPYRLQKRGGSKRKHQVDSSWGEGHRLHSRVTSSWFFAARRARNRTDGNGDEESQGKAAANGHDCVRGSRTRTST